MDKKNQKGKNQSKMGKGFHTDSTNAQSSKTTTAVTDNSPFTKDQLKLLYKLLGKLRSPQQPLVPLHNQKTKGSCGKLLEYTSAWKREYMFLRYLTRKTIGNAEKREGLYYLIPQDWENRAYQVKGSPTRECEISHRVSYPLRNNRCDFPFSLIHTDIWGPSRVTGIFQKFYKMITIQFDAKVKVIRSHNGGEYFSGSLNMFLMDNGIIHESSCTATPEQNSVVERKNRHLLEGENRSSEDQSQDIFPLPKWEEIISVDTQGGASGQGKNVEKIVLSCK
ncbi:hypothetical protein CK203_017641 [Vitis vinifera]|uniref:Integrase catalytic domain-containing protein n=1 Tax=Vitis vinifera TaxID=29760 RepID=A0A438JH77_VITVI|nr:hypothetical protein CK203_017641 [Vitis vinifera]